MTMPPFIKGFESEIVFGSLLDTKYMLWDLCAGICITDRCAGILHTWLFVGLYAHTCLGNRREM